MQSYENEIQDFKLIENAYIEKFGEAKIITIKKTIVDEKSTKTCSKCDGNNAADCDACKGTGLEAGSTTLTEKKVIIDDNTYW